MVPEQGKREAPSQAHSPPLAPTVPLYDHLSHHILSHRAIPRYRRLFPKPPNGFHHVQWRGVSPRLFHETVTCFQKIQTRSAMFDRRREGQSLAVALLGMQGPRACLVAARHDLGKGTAINWTRSIGSLRQCGHLQLAQGYFHFSPIATEYSSEGYCHMR